MKAPKVISRKCLPVKLPLLSSTILYMALDLYSAPEWLWGVAITVMTILWIATIWLLFIEKRVNIFESTQNKKQETF
ncbi:MAG: hypothetical protein RJQ09_21360 [Cyclobacteriaceae bacterium]